ncbi:TraB/GumN family protein [Pseudomonadota bacterium]
MNWNDRYPWRLVWLWPLLFLLLLAGQVAASEVPFGQGLLFRIERPGVTPSHLFGTMHSDQPEVVRLARPVSTAFDGSGTLALEMEMGAETMMAAMVFSDGRELRGVIGDELYQRAVEAVALRGMPEMAIRHYKPWAVLTILSMPPPTTGQFLDLVLYQSALAQGKPVVGLETAQEQIAVFEGFSEVEQVAMLRETLDTQHLLGQMFEELTAAYLQRDLVRLMGLNDQYGPADPGLEGRIQEQLIDRRNRLMVQRMLPLLKKGRAFIAVGALHLPGESGILSLLSAQGYLVTRVY